MYKELILFRNELKNKFIPKYKLIGIVSELLLSKQIFLKNMDIEDFLMEVFGLKFKAYLYRSRTMIVARVTKEIIAINVDVLNRFEDGAEVTAESLLASGAISKIADGVKILGNGELTKKLNVKVNAVSETAKSKIEAAGGTVEVI